MPCVPAIWAVPWIVPLSVGSALLGSRLPFGNFVGCVIVPPAVAAATVNLEHIVCEDTAA